MARARRRAASNDLIGRTDLLEVLPGESRRGSSRLDLDVLLDQGSIAGSEPRFCVAAANPPFDKGELAEQMVRDALPGDQGQAAAASCAYAVRNVNRSIGARLSGEIARAHGDQGMPDDCLITSSSPAPPARASACGTPAACT